MTIVDLYNLVNNYFQEIMIEVLENNIFKWDINGEEIKPTLTPKRGIERVKMILLANDMILSGQY